MLLLRRYGQAGCLTLHYMVCNSAEIAHNGRTLRPMICHNNRAVGETLRSWAGNRPGVNPDAAPRSLFGKPLGYGAFHRSHLERKGFGRSAFGSPSRNTRMPGFQVGRAWPPIVGDRTLAGHGGGQSTPVWEGGVHPRAIPASCIRNLRIERIGFLDG